MNNISDTVTTASTWYLGALCTTALMVVPYGKRKIFKFLPVCSSFFPKSLLNFILKILLQIPVYEYTRHAAFPDHIAFNMLKAPLWK